MTIENKNGTKEHGKSMLHGYLEQREKELREHNVEVK